MLALASLAAFLVLSPEGCLTKADMIGYAVCHRIGSHSFVIGGRQLPLCARCTGTFTGALVGLMGQAMLLRRRRASDFPPALILIVLVGFVLLMAADGLNSYLDLLPQASGLYQPQNWLRLATGALHGLTLSALVYPVLNFTLWREPQPQRAIRSGLDLLLLMGLEAAMVGIVLTGWAPLLYPLALLSTLGVVALLTSVNTVLILMIMQRENRASRWPDLLVPFLAGITASLIEIGLIDIVRYQLTGTFQGLPPLQ
jgi:uncharacterized membrane protein